MISFSGSSFGVRIGLDSSLSELKECVCERWSEINHCLFEMYVIRDEKEIIVSTDEEIKCMICSTVIKGENTVNVFVRLTECSNSNATANDTCSASSGSVTRSDTSEVRQPLKSSVWANAITGVGQRFERGAEDFRLKLRQFSIERGFDYKFKRNDATRITVVCSKDEERGCQWRIHASQKFNLPNFFVIKRMVSEHTCGIGYKDLRKPPMSSKLVKNAIMDLVRDRPLVKPSEIIDDFRRDYGVRLSYYYAYAGRELAAKEIHGDESLSYNNLVWYLEALNKTNPGSYTILEINEETKKFQRLFVSFEAQIFGFKYCRSLLCLDGTFLKGKFKGCMLAATGMNGNGGILIFFYFSVQV